jgi:hypothetical protein
MLCVSFNGLLPNRKMTETKINPVCQRWDTCISVPSEMHGEVKYTSGVPPSINLGHGIVLSLRA